MAEEEEQPEEEPKKGSKKPLLIGLVLALLLGGGGFYAIWSGMFLAPPSEVTAADEAEDESPTPLPDVAFVPIPPLVVNVGGAQENRHLRFQAQVEVAGKSVEPVNALMPRIVDVLNGYLRAVDPAELERKAALVSIRAQLLRRIQVVTGPGHVRDLLIMEFVLN